MTPSEHYDNLAIACIRKATELEALTEQLSDPKDREKYREEAAKERKNAIGYLEIAKGLAAHV